MIFIAILVTTTYVICHLVLSWPARRVVKWGGNWGPRAENTWKGGEGGEGGWRGGAFLHILCTIPYTEFFELKACAASVLPTLLTISVRVLPRTPRNHPPRHPRHPHTPHPRVHRWFAARCTPRTPPATPLPQFPPPLRGLMPKRKVI